ncbi:unnamed protein product [Calicophoron daubneyi]|uniref:Transmembrane protein n=1 Tax=Calicophoron daubneyi TaxID=300641 RepID=A0AAV2TKY3_CALDB
MYTILSVLAVLTYCAQIPRFTDATNNPELLEQLWNQLYRLLPGPSMAPQLSSDLPLSVDLSVSLENVELQNTASGPICRASLTIFAEWPVLDEHIAGSKLVELLSGGLRLDAQRVWHPELIAAGSYRFDRLTQRLELRSESNIPSDTQKTSTVMGRNKLIPSANSADSTIMRAGFKQHEMSPETSASSSLRTQGRPGVLSLTTGNLDGPRYALTESMAVEVACSYSQKFSQIGSVLCSILIRQGGSMHAQPVIKWAERKACLVSKNAQQRASHITVAKLFGSQMDEQGMDHSLAINICFSQTGRMTQCAIVPLLITLVSLLIIWSGPPGTRASSWAQCFLLLLISGFWFWISEHTTLVTKNPNPIDVWCLICLLIILSACCLSVYQERWILRILKQRKRRLHQANSATMMQNKNASVIVSPPTNPNANCFQGCACGTSSCGVCNDGCGTCVGAAVRTSGGFASSNGTNGVYCSNSSCGASGGSGGHVCNGLGNMPGMNTASNSPAPPLGFSGQPMNTGANKMDNYQEGFLCSGNSDSGQNGIGGFLHGFRWRNGNSRRPTGLNNGLVGLDLPDCQICLCNLQNAVQPSGASAPAYAQACRSLPQEIPSNCLITSFRIVFTVCFAVTAAVLWISVLAQGIHPEACLGTTGCQPIPVAYLN